MTPTILIVDEGTGDARALGDLVRDLGRVVVAGGRESALAQVDLQEPDLVLVDGRGPGGDRDEIRRRLRAGSGTKGSSVIFVIGADSEPVEAGDLGAVDYITTPFNPALVRARVRNHLALARALADLRAANEALQRMEATDPLTGLANRRRLIEVGAQELLRAQRTPQSAGLLCALMVDIDQFKTVNEAHGHPAGDAVIQAVARACSQGVRAIDLVGRLGDDEFAVVAPMTDGRGGAELAERLRERVAAAPVPWGAGPPISVTVSVGVAQGTAKTRSFDSLLSAAEQALRRAKGAGRNRVAATIYGATDELPT